MQSDPYQKRYIKHQEAKKKQLLNHYGVKKSDIKIENIFSLLELRRSQRNFINEPVPDQQINYILHAGALAPSSCNRHGVRVKVVRDRNEKELLGGIMVGGVGWMHRADTIFLFLADPFAYKSAREKTFMHYADVGFLAMSMWLACEKYGLGASYINPNVSHQDVFDLKYAPYICCGALAVGHYDKNKRAPEAQRIDINDLTI